MSNEPVYPFQELNSEGLPRYEAHFGLTKRELFALHIYCSQDSKSTEGAVYWADQLLKELSK